MKGFGSDNHSGIHPLMLQSILESNSEHQPSYGTDAYSEKSFSIFKKMFGDNANVHYVYNGTAANVLSLQAAMKRHETVLCSDVSHIHLDECGAPEFFAGKIQTIPSLDGKIIISEIEKYLIRKGDQHYSQPRLISITQPTELGTCYTLAEIKDIVTIAKKHQLYVHVDGARLANAVYFLKTSFMDMLTNLGVDIVSLGGTKNGFAFGEAVVILNKDLNHDFKYLRKQAAQLPSKTRFIAAQFNTYLSDDNYLKISEHSVSMAHYLYIKMVANPAFKVTRPQESNAVFAIIPKSMIKKLREHFFFYVWDENTMECRFMTSWDTTKADVDAFILLASSLQLE